MYNVEGTHTLAFIPYSLITHYSKMQRAPVTNPSITNQGPKEPYDTTLTRPALFPEPPVNSTILLVVEAAEAMEDAALEGFVVDLLLEVELTSSADDVSVSKGGSSVAELGVGKEAVAVISSRDDWASALLIAYIEVIIAVATELEVDVLLVRLGT